MLFVNEIFFSLTLFLPSTWFECVSMMVILLNCVTLGMYQPCDDMDCLSNRCKILQVSSSLSIMEIYDLLVDILTFFITMLCELKSSAKSCGSKAHNKLALFFNFKLLLV